MEIPSSSHEKLRTVRIIYRTEKMNDFRQVMWTRLFYPYGHIRELVTEKNYLHLLPLYIIDTLLHPPKLMHTQTHAHMH